jgi:hypothetical protein
MNKLAIISFVAAFICGCNQSQNPVETFHSKLNPVSGAFGWNLGDKLPDSAQVQTNNDDFSLSYDFTPDKPVQGSDLIYELDLHQLNLTADHTIYAITAFGYVHSDDFNIGKDALVQALTDKYGIREHIRNSSTMETYDFGTEDRSVELMVSQEGTYPSLSLTYFDQTLRAKAHDEDNQRKADAKNSLKEDFKKQGL